MTVVSYYYLIFSLAGDNLLILLNSIWALILSVRTYIKERVDFLEVKDPEKDISTPKLQWLEEKSGSEKTGVSGVGGVGGVGTDNGGVVLPTLLEVFAEGKTTFLLLFFTYYLSFFFF